MRTPSAKRPVAALLLVLFTGCQTWQPTTASPRTLFPDERPTSVRLTLPDGAVVTISDPVLRNDSIVSAVAPAAVSGSTEFAVFATPTAPAALSVALVNVRTLEVKRFSLTRTIGFAALIVVVSLSWARAAGVAAGTGEPGEGPEPKG